MEGLNINSDIEDNFKCVMADCRQVFYSKLQDYSVTWLEYRIMTVVDHILIKALRIKTLEQNNGEMSVDEGKEPEYLGIINYALIGLILYYYDDKLPSSNNDITDGAILQIKEFYDTTVEKIQTLLVQKNHDYGDAWKQMEPTTFTDIIIARIYRMKSIIKNEFNVQSENIDAQLMDIINYCVFALVKA